MQSAGGERYWQAAVYVHAAVVRTSEDVLRIGCRHLGQPLISARLGGHACPVLGAPRAPLGSVLLWPRLDAVGAAAPVTATVVCRRRLVGIANLIRGAGGGGGDGNLVSSGVPRVRKKRVKSTPGDTASSVPSGSSTSCSRSPSASPRLSHRCLQLRHKPLSELRRTRRRRGGSVRLVVRALPLLVHPVPSP